MDARDDPNWDSILPQTAANRIEDLLQQFMTRAHELLETQDHMRGLLAAVVAVAEDLELEAVLSRVVHAARGLVRAKYAALGVLAPDRTTLSHFITVGMSDEVVREIGPRPTGHGVLGLLISEPHPLRLHDLGAHPESYGFPAHHPPMKTFLGVPIRVRDEVFGNLYLTEKEDGGDFSAEDEDLVVALAAAAGVAIQNARLFDDRARRQEWLEATMDVARQLLDLDDPDHGMEIVAERALEVSRAAFAAVLMPAGAGQGLSRDAIVGDTAAVDGDGWAHAADFAFHADQAGGLYIAPGGDVFGPSRAEGPAGQVMLVPLGRAIPEDGILLLARGARTTFPVADAEMAPVFCSYASLALQVVRSHRLREELLVVADRDRIARDLHDLVIQRIFAAGLSLQGMRQFTPQKAAEEKIRQITAELDETISSLRSTIYSLNEARTKDSLAVRLVRIVQDGTSSFPTEPRVELHGPIDTAVPADVAAEALAVLTEGVSNVIRHAEADSLWVSAGVADGRFELVVMDNGKGMGETRRRSGLQNVEDRAVALGGVFEVGAGADGGTRLRWAVPVRSARTP